MKSKSNLVKIWLVRVLVVALPMVASAQSTRPGWGATPYHDGLGNGVTFRVWAPNATSVYLPGSFNGWSTTATPLVQEQTNGSMDGVWSADVAGATNLSQYKYFINNGGGVWKHDPRARWVTAAGTAAGANDIVYDPTAFNWNGDNMAAPAQNDLFIYEMHMGTFPQGASPSRFVAATNKLDYLKNLGVNAVELLPIVEFGNGGGDITGVIDAIPAGRLLPTCRATVTSGLGKRVNSPSRIIASAPLIVSSAGWPIRINVPCQVLLLRAMI